MKYFRLVKKGGPPAKPAEPTAPVDRDGQLTQRMSEQRKERATTPTEPADPEGAILTEGVVHDDPKFSIVKVQTLEEYQKHAEGAHWELDAQNMPYYLSKGYMFYVLFDKADAFEGAKKKMLISVDPGGDIEAFDMDETPVSTSELEAAGVDTAVLKPGTPALKESAEARLLEEKRQAQVDDAIRKLRALSEKKTKKPEAASPEEDPDEAKDDGKKKEAKKPWEKDKEEPLEEGAVRPRHRFNRTSLDEAKAPFERPTPEAIIAKRVARVEAFIDKQIDLAESSGRYDEYLKMGFDLVYDKTGVNFHVDKDSLDAVEEAYEAAGWKVMIEGTPGKGYYLVLDWPTKAKAKPKPVGSAPKEEPEPMEEGAEPAASRGLLADLQAGGYTESRGDAPRRRRHRSEEGRRMAEPGDEGPHGTRSRRSLQREAPMDKKRMNALVHHILSGEADKEINERRRVAEGKEAGTARPRHRFDAQSRMNEGSEVEAWERRIDDIVTKWEKSGSENPLVLARWMDGWPDNYKQEVLNIIGRRRQAKDRHIPKQGDGPPVGERRQALAESRYLSVRGRINEARRQGKSKTWDTETEK